MIKNIRAEACATAYFSQGMHGPGDDLAVVKQTSMFTQHQSPHKSLQHNLTTRVDAGPARMWPAGLRLHVRFPVLPD